MHGPTRMDAHVMRVSGAADGRGVRTPVRTSRNGRKCAHRWLDGHVRVLSRSRRCLFLL